MAATRVLVVEDEEALQALLDYNLGKEGFEVTLVGDGEEALLKIEEDRPDVIVLDWMLPNVSGIEVCRRVRSKHETQNIPIVMLTARGEEADRIRGLDMGADDYLPKPFSIEELQVRIAAILRRVAYERSVTPAANQDAVRFDDQRSDLQYEGRWVGLTATEYRLMKVLHDAAGEVLSKPFLYQQALHRGFSQHDRSLDMHVSNIRRKLAREQVATLRLESVWGKGYVLELQAS